MAAIGVKNARTSAGTYFASFSEYPSDEVSDVEAVWPPGPPKVID